MLLAGAADGAGACHLVGFLGWCRGLAWVGSGLGAEAAGGGMLARHLQAW